MKITIKKIFFLVITMSILFSFSANAENIATSVVIFTDTYSGSFSGTVENGSPSGEGTFLCTDGTQDFSLSGTWRNGILKGNASVSYGDGKQIDVNYKNGLMSGKVTERNVDGTYRSFSCDKGRPHGVITYYTQDNTPYDFDYFYQMQPITELISRSTEADYNSLLNSDSFLTPQKISGTVLRVFGTSSSAYVVVEDNKQHIYVLTYKDKASDKYNQAIVPNLTAGDTITAYGFLQKQSSLSSVNDLAPSVLVTNQEQVVSDTALDDTLVQKNNTLPFIRLFAAEVTEEREFDRLHPSYEYEDILRHPYQYSGLECVAIGQVTHASINYEKNTVSMHIRSGEDGHEYYIRYSFSDGDPLPSIGNVISADGTYYGNDKSLVTVNSSTDAPSNFFVIYPRIHTTSISILS